jgi:beta-galactosidase GanA
VGKFYRSLVGAGIHPDVIDAAEPLEKYKMIFTPSAYTLEENDFAERAAEWVRDGGVWVVGPISDVRTSIGTKYKSAPYGSLEDILGETLTYILPDDNGRIALENNEGEEVHGGAVYELFDKGDFEPWLTVKSGHSAILGKCAAFAKRLGKGYIVMLGTLPEQKELSRIVTRAAQMADARICDVDDGIMVTRRVRDDDTLYIVASVGGKAGEFRFSGEYRDILSGEVYKGSIKLEPYELHIIRKA